MNFGELVEAYAETLGREFRVGAITRLHQVMTGEGTAGITPVKTGRLRASSDVTRVDEPLQPPPPEGFEHYPWVASQDIAEDLRDTPMAVDVRYAQTAPYAAKVWDMPKYAERLPAARREILAWGTRQALKMRPASVHETIGGGR